MDAHDIENVIEEELEKMSVNFSDVRSDSDTDIEDDFTASNEKLTNDLPDSVLVYFKAVRNRVKTFEQLILEDNNDLEIVCNEMFSPSQHAELLNELDSNSDEDPLKLKERIMSETEEDLGPLCETHNLNGDYETEYDTHKDTERQLRFEWRRLEERLRQEEEQRLAELEAEREQRLKSEREEKEKMRRRSEHFNEELRRTRAANQFKYLEPVEGDNEITQSLPLEMANQQEVIKRLEEQIAEERRVFEEIQKEERRISEARCTAAATKLQAAFRGTLVRRWSKVELNKKRDEERRRLEERIEREKRREREERMKMEWEKERRRVEEEEQRHRDEAERRRAEYERAKQQEHHRLERECMLEEQKRRRKEKEEAKNIEDERKIKKEEKQKRIEQMIVEDEMRKVQENKGKKIKEDEKAKVIHNKIKRKEDVESPEETEKRRVEDKREKVQEDEVKKSKEREKSQRTVDELKRTNDELTVMIEDRRAEEVRRKVQEDEEKTRKEEEKEAERKSMETKTQKMMEERSMEEERKRKEVEEAKRVEDERERKEEEKQKSMAIRIEEKRKVQMEEEKERKAVVEARRKEDGRKKNYEEKQKNMDRRRIEEEKKRKEEEEEKVTEARIKRKEEEEKPKRLKEIRLVEKIRSKQKVQDKENEHEQIQKGQRKKLKQKEIKGEERLLKTNEDGENMEERNRNVIKDNVNRLETERENRETDEESEKTTKCGKDEKCVDNESQLCVSQSVSVSKSVLARTLSSRSGQDEQHSFFPESILHTGNGNITVNPSEGKNVTDTREPQCVLDDLSSACLSDSTEQKRLAWMMNCTPWSKLSMQNKRKGLGAPPRRMGHRRAPGQSLLPLPVDTVLKSGPWSSLNQVTSVTLEDLSGCSLSTLSECTRLQSLTLRRCRLQALDGLNQCTALQHIDLQENNITYVDCGGLARLEVLLLGRNQLTSIHGLDNAVNLSVLQLSHNIISRISGLGSLKNLHRLTVDHNQLISTRGLGEAFMLLHLDCSYNHLSHVEGLENCALLNTLDLRGNSLTEMPVLKNHVLLRELYLDDNSICSLHGLDSCWLPLLRCLSVPQNSITQLPLLVDLHSLKTLNVSHNCLSELRNICMSLQGCTHLQELSITDNPVQQENNWRSSVLAVNPSLIKLNGEQTGASGKLSVDSTQLWSFQALCQAHQHQIDSVLQRHCMEISSAPSALHAQLLVGNHTAELFQLAEEQRYAHECGDSGVCKTAVKEPVASSNRQELSDWKLSQEKSGQERTPNPAEHKTLSWQAPHLPNFTHHFQPTSDDHKLGCADICISPTQKFRETLASEEGYNKHGVQTSRMDLKTVAVMVIQRRWREHRQKKQTSHLGPPAKAPARLSRQREVKSCTTKPECLNKDYAATVVQAVWRGYMLRKRLTRALMLTQISEGDEAFEEVDMDEFIFDEEAMEKDWISLHPDMSPSSVLPYSEQLQLPKPLLHLPELQKSECVQPWKPRQAWISSGEAPVSEQSHSPDPSTRTQSTASTQGKCYFSERFEKILEEWGITSGSTAHLMLKRAQRMKPQKQKHRKKYLAGRGDVSAQEAVRGEPEQTYKHTQKRHRTYQWLQTQAMPSRKSSAPSVSDHFLPELDPKILNGGKVQLVASTDYRETPDSAVTIDNAGFSSPQNHLVHTQIHSAGHAKKDVPSPQRVTLAPSRKERMSFRDNPVQLSGGWGGGKKRYKANKFK